MDVFNFMYNQYMAAGISDNLLSHEKVMQSLKKAGKNMNILLKNVIWGKQTVRAYDLIFKRRKAGARSKKINYLMSDICKGKYSRLSDEAAFLWLYILKK